MQIPVSLWAQSLVEYQMNGLILTWLSSTHIATHTQFQPELLPLGPQLSYSGIYRLVVQTTVPGE